MLKGMELGMGTGIGTGLERSWGMGGGCRELWAVPTREVAVL